MLASILMTSYELRPASSRVPDYELVTIGLRLVRFVAFNSAPDHQLLLSSDEFCQFPKLSSVCATSPSVPQRLHALLVLNPFPHRLPKCFKVAA